MKTTTLLFLLFILYGITMFGQAKNVRVQLTSRSVDNVHLKNTIETNTSKFLTKLNTSYSNHESFDIKESYISPMAMTKVGEVFEDSPFYCKNSSLQLDLLRTQYGLQLRNIIIVVGEKEQSLVIDFLENGLIDDVYFGLELHHYENVMTYNSVIDRTRREIILNFIENFRTAYIRKDIGLIETVFSDQALIITGKVVQPDRSHGDIYKASLSDKQIEYQVLTKGQYIDRLRNVFNRTAYLNLGFEEIEVNQHRKYPDFYGVQLNQTWTTSSYSDQGYLFLLIQFRGDNHPLIWVRTWQDAKDFEKDSTFGLHNFKIYEGAIH